MADRRLRPPLPLAERETVDAGDVARLLGRSRTLILEWDKAGLLPSPMRPGGATTLWRLRELRAWVESGMPPRHSWSWRPSEVLEMTVYYKALTAQVARLSALALDAERRIAAGERFVNVSRG